MADAAVPPMCKGHEPVAFAAFALVSLGQGWLLLDALMMQIPCFQRVQPEGLALAAWMGSATSAGSLCSVPLLLGVFVANQRASSGRSRALRRSSRHRLDECLMVGTMATTLLGLGLGALCWHQHSAQHSHALLALSFVAGLLGSAKMVIMMPWQLQHEPRLIGATVLGGTLAAGATALLALVQRPGSAPRFSPSAFLAAVAMLALPSAFALCAIKRWGIGLRRAGVAPVAPRHAERAPALKDALAHSPALDQSPMAAGPRPHAAGDGTCAADACGEHALRTPLVAPPASARLGFPPPPWVARALSLWLRYTAIQSVVWGVTPGVLPYAAHRALPAHARAGAADELLGLTQQLSFFGLLGGALLSLRTETHRYSLNAQMGAMALLVSVPLALALAGERAAACAGPAACALLVTSVTSVRFLEGLCVPMVFRIVAEDASGTYGRYRALVQRALTLGERVMTTLGSLATLALVNRVLAPGAASSTDE